MDDLIRRSDAIQAFDELLKSPYARQEPFGFAVRDALKLARDMMRSDAPKALSIPAVDAVEVPETGIGDLSDGYHTFNGLYHQRLILFAALVKAYKDRAWKSYRHEDGELCFDGGWFIVGIDTPEGSYTYHYENKDFDLFDCEELPVGKHWDGHTEDDVTRLLSLAVDAVEVVRCRECKHYKPSRYNGSTTHYCGVIDGFPKEDWFCKDGKRREDGDA